MLRVVKQPCTCPIRDWRAFRDALGITSQAQFGAILGLSERAIRALEDAPEHRCVPLASQMLVRLYLQRPAVREKCRLARVEYDAAPRSIAHILRAS